MFRARVEWPRRIMQLPCQTKYIGTGRAWAGRATPGSSLVCGGMTEPREEPVARVFRFGQEFPPVRTGPAITGRRFPGCTGRFPKVGKPFPNIGKPFPNLGKPLPDIGKPFPNIGKPFPNIGKPFPNIPQTFPRSGNLWAILGSSQTILGNPFPTLGSPFPTLGSPFPTLGSLCGILGSPFPTLGNLFGILGNHFLNLAQTFAKPGTHRAMSGSGQAGSGSRFSLPVQARRSAVNRQYPTRMRRLEPARDFMVQQGQRPETSQPGLGCLGPLARRSSLWRSSQTEFKVPDRP